MDLPFRVTRPQWRARVRGLAVVLLFLVTATVVDPRAARWVAGSKSHLLDLLVGVLNPLGDGVTLLVASVMLAVLCRALRRPRLHDAAWLAALAFAVSGIFEYTLKHLVGRPRPDAVLSGIVLLGPSFEPDIDSFPSGHATSVFSVATVFASFYPRLRWPLYGVAAAVALGRVYLQRHYVSDVVAGALIGVVIASQLLRYRPLRPPYIRMGDAQGSLDVS
jgi:membrane-associated phospholipid phosphatase